MKILNIKRLFLCLAILFIVIFVCITQGFAWEITADFEKGTLGLVAVGDSGFTDAGSRTTFSDHVAAKGFKSAKLEWQTGDEGFNTCRGGMDYLTPLVSGVELWVRGYYYFKSPPGKNWDWYSIENRNKILRIHVRDVNENHLGYLSIIAGSDGRLRLANEIADYAEWLDSYLEVDRWQSLEIYVKLSTSNPVFRIWKNGVLIATDTHSTLLSSSDEADFTYVMSLWNGGPAQNQDMYFDEFILTTETPANRDLHGNPMIGPNPGDFVPPDPPTGLRIIELSN